MEKWVNERKIGKMKKKEEGNQRKREKMIVNSSSNDDKSEFTILTITSCYMM